MNQASPLPIGYYEVQRGWIDSDSAGAARRYTEALDDIIASTKRERPDLMMWSTRIESVRDGAGVEHTSLFVGFVPKEPLSPPLDPHNLNDAPTPKIGAAPIEAEWGIGAKERKFK